MVYEIIWIVPDNIKLCSAEILQKKSKLCYSSYQTFPKPCYSDHSHFFSKKLSEPVNYIYSKKRTNDWACRWHIETFWRLEKGLFQNLSETFILHYVLTLPKRICSNYDVI